MRYALIAAWLLLFPCAPAVAQLSINFGSPGVNIGINLGAYPTLQRVPGYPVYYAPGVNSNYFFYDGLYWVYDADNWYASSWYNGPWRSVDPYDVPPYVLRVPVRYYRHAPSYFHGWSVNDSPRWGDHWGEDWQKRRSGWDQWNHNSAPAPAPLPTYQRQYTGSRYPQGAQQAVIETRDYRYQPKDPVAQQHYEYRNTQAKSAPQQAPATQQQRPQAQAAPAAHAQPQYTQQPAPQHQEAAARPQQQAAPKPQQQAAPSQQAQRQQPPAQAPKPQRTEPKPQPEAAPHDQKAPQPQAQQKAPPQQQAQHEQKPQQPQAEQRAPQAKEQGKERAPEKDNKDNKEKGQDH